MAGGWLCLLAWSHHLSDCGDFSQALRLTPNDPTLWRAAGVAELDRSPAVAARNLLNALARDPYDAESLIALGLLAEARSDYPLAERLFLQAASLSRRFRARWALAYYYARRGDTVHFWPAAAHAAHTVAADVRPIYRLAMAQSGDARALLGLNSQPELAAYFQVALDRGDEDEIRGVGQLLNGSQHNRALLQSAAQRLIQQGKLVTGLALFNRIAADQDRLDAAKGHSLINGAFDFRTHRAWDWKLFDVEGVDVVKNKNLKLEFRGTQPEKAVLLEQTVPVLPQRDYRFGCAYQAIELKSPSGLQWQVLPLEGGAPLASSPFLAEARSAVAFRAEKPFVRLALVYTRVPGTMLQQGILSLQSSVLELAP